MKLRPHQKEDMKHIKKYLKKHHHLLYGMATGGGKSAIIYAMVKRAIKHKQRVLIIAPRRKLIKQLADTLMTFYPSIIMGSNTNYDPLANVYIASTATLSRRLKKEGRKYLGDIDILIIDEVHINFGSASMQGVVDLYWDSAKWVGLSATPITAQGYRLEGWDHTYYKWQTRKLIDAGWLTDVKVMVEDKPEGLDNVKLTGGDYNEAELSDFMSDNSRVSNIYKIWKKYAQHRRTMVFAVTINHANIILEEFLQHGVNADVVHSDIDESIEDTTIDNFGNGKIDVLINVGKLTTGFDEPSVDCLLLARPTKSISLYMQIIGRGLRLYEGKKECLILDVAGNIAQNGYPTMERDFNMVKPERKSNPDRELAETVCPYCDFLTQKRNCSREIIETKKYTTTRWYCPNCNEIIDEKVVDNREVERMKLVEDYTNIDKVTDADVSAFIRYLAKVKKYKKYWVNYIARDYNMDDEFKKMLKLEVNKFRAGMIKVDTALKHIKDYRAKT